MTLSTDDFGFVQRMLREEAGLVLEADKDYLVANRLGRLAAVHGEPDVGGLLARVRNGNDRGLRAAIAESMTIQETYFFRDPWLFASLRDEALPALVRARTRERVLRLWCAACSTGQEIYSVCLLLQEHFPELLDWPIEILASDYSETALAQARSGSYSQLEVNRGLPAALLAKYFNRVGTRWQISAELRDRVYFTRLNLIEPWPVLPAFDIVLLRNVLIYFDAATRRDVLAGVQRQLRRDGYLYMGGTESPLGLVPGFFAGAGGRACHYQLQPGRTAS